MAAVDLVLFDLGGVLVEVRGVFALQAMAGLESESATWERWLGCRWVRDFERGRCDPDDFAEGLVSDWRLSTDPARFLDEFRRWPTGLFAGALDLVDEVRTTAAVGCLSNSNAIHWTEQRTWFRDGDAFDHTFLSHEMGLIKPDREVYDHVAAAAGVDPGRVVFLDDNALNVDAARRAGFLAQVVSGVTGARRALAQLGLLAG